MGKRTFTLLIISCLLIFHLKAQNTGIIEGYLIGSEDTGAVSYATVSVFNTLDSSMVSFGLSDNNGGFELNKLPLNKPLRLLISHVMYNPVIHNFMLTDSQPVHRPDTFFLIEKSLMMSETVITWEVPPILVKNDTVEFNADAFITRPGSMVEDLLKRIPGLEIGSDGQMTMGGKRVSKITLDSKQFFSDDPAILLKNLPAKAIEKIQVSEERDEFGRLTNSGDITINLTLKKWAKTGHFGKAFAGYGTDKRYESGGIWNFFRDTLQVSVLGYGNNLSNAGFSFSDIYQLGGFQRSGINSMWMDNNGNFEINGNSFGGGRGITESGGGGFNLNYDVPRKYHFNTSYFIGFTDTRYTNLLDQKTFFGDSTLSTFQSIGEIYKTESHTVNLNFSYTPDTIHEFNITPVFSYKEGWQDRGMSTRNSFSNSGNRNFLDNNLEDRNKNWSFNNEVNWGGTWKKINASLYASQQINRKSGDGLNDIRTIQYYDTSVSFFETQSRQVRDYSTSSDNFDYNGSLNWNISKKLTYSFRTGLSHLNAINNTLVYERDSATGQLSVLLPDLSTQFTEKRLTKKVYSGLQYLFTPKWSVMVYANAFSVDLDLQNTLKTSSVNRRFDYVVPEMFIQYKTGSGAIRLEYAYENTLPASYNLIDITNNNNPNKITRGNPNLSDNHQHEVTLYSSSYNAKKKMNYRLYLGYNRVYNQVVTSSRYDELGRQVSTPVNLPAGFVNESFTVSSNMRKSFTVKENTHGIGGGLWAGNRNTYNLVNQNIFLTSSSYVYFNVNYTFLNPDKLDIKLEYAPSASQSRVEGLSGNNIRIGQNVNIECWVAVTKKFWAEAKLNYAYQRIASNTFIPNNMALLNLSVTRLVLKENRGQIRLSVFDVLQQNKSLERMVNVNYTSETQSNVVTRYVMLSFVYNFHQLGVTGRTSKGISFF